MQTTKWWRTVSVWPRGGPVAGDGAARTEAQPGVDAPRERTAGIFRRIEDGDGRLNGAAGEFEADVGPKGAWAGGAVVAPTVAVDHPALQAGASRAADEAPAAVGLRDGETDEGRALPCALKPVTVASVASDRRPGCGRDRRAGGVEGWRAARLGTDAGGALRVGLAAKRKLKRDEAGPSLRESNPVHLLGRLLGFGGRRVEFGFGWIVVGVGCGHLRTDVPAPRVQAGPELCGFLRLSGGEIAGFAEVVGENEDYVGFYRCGAWVSGTRRETDRRPRRGDRRRRTGRGRGFIGGEGEKGRYA